MCLPASVSFLLQMLVFLLFLCVNDYVLALLYPQVINLALPQSIHRLCSGVG